MYYRLLSYFVGLMAVNLLLTSSAVATLNTSFEPDDLWLQLSVDGNKDGGQRKSGLSLWWLMNKFASSGLTPDPTKIESAKHGFKDADVAFVDVVGYTATYLKPIGYRHYDTPLSDTKVTLKDSHGGTLVEFQWAHDGTMEWLDQPGDAGKMAFDGWFDVTGGSLFDAGLVNGEFYLNFTWNTIYGRGRRDAYSTNGVLNFYKDAPQPPTEVPEPASALLLGAGAIGLLKKKKKCS